MLKHKKINKVLMWTFLFLGMMEEIVAGGVSNENIEKVFGSTSMNDDERKAAASQDRFGITYGNHAADTRPLSKEFAASVQEQHNNATELSIPETVVKNSATSQHLDTPKPPLHRRSSEMKRN